MICLTHCPSCKHAIFYGYGNGCGCYLTKCKYESAEDNNRVITSNRILTEEEIKSLMNEDKEVSDVDMNINEKACDYYIVDELGGVHTDGIGFSPDGTFCGECTKVSCKDCPSITKDLQGE